MKLDSQDEYVPTMERHDSHCGEIKEVDASIVDNILRLSREMMPGDWPNSWAISFSKRLQDLIWQEDITPPVYRHILNCKSRWRRKSVERPHTEQDIQELEAHLRQSRSRAVKLAQQDAAWLKRGMLGVAAIHIVARSIRENDESMTKESFHRSTHLNALNRLYRFTCRIFAMNRGSGVYPLQWPPLHGDEVAFWYEKKSSALERRYIEAWHSGTPLWRIHGEAYGRGNPGLGGQLLLQLGSLRLTIVQYQFML